MHPPSDGLNTHTREVRPRGVESEKQREVELAQRKTSSRKCHEAIGRCSDDDGQGYGNTMREGEKIGGGAP